MKKLKDMLDIWTDGLKVRGMKTPPLCTIYELMDIHSGVQKVTINATVVQILQKCKIPVSPYGIGWKIGK